MKAEVTKAADLTVMNLSSLDVSSHVSLREAALVVRAFLINLLPSVSRWKPWVRYAVGIVIAILNVLLGEAEDIG